MLTVRTRSDDAEYMKQDVATLNVQNLNFVCFVQFNVRHTVFTIRTLIKKVIIIFFPINSAYYVRYAMSRTNNNLYTFVKIQGGPLLLHFQYLPRQNNYIIIYSVLNEREKIPIIIIIMAKELADFLSNGSHYRSTVPQAH